MPRNTLLLSAFALGTVVYGCTQDFGQFEDGSGASGPGSGASGPGSGAAGPSSGSGGSQACDGDGDCLDSNPCTSESCDDGACVYIKAQDGPLGNDEPDDCKDLSCQNGVVDDVDDDSEQPDDDNACTQDACDGGEPQFDPVPAGTPCGGDGMACDGDGTCVGCFTDDDCGVASECLEPVCTQAGECDNEYAPSGTPIDEQTDDDCKVVVCDGMGDTMEVPDDQDTPPLDGNMCTTEACNAGEPISTNDPAGDGCNDGVCDGNGNCIECLVDNDCVGLDVCNSANQCVECEGPNDCDGDEVCDGGECCDPQTCQQLLRTCGMPSNGCGGTVNCNDGIKNGTETDIDCGGPLTCLVKCANGKICLQNADCGSNKCMGGVCIP